MDLYNPARIDRDALLEYAREFGGKIVGERVDQVLDSLINRMGAGYDADPLDEFAPCAVHSPEEIRDVPAVSTLDARVTTRSILWPGRRWAPRSMRS